VPVDFESGASWWDQVIAAGFDARQPALVASTGVSMYLTKPATTATLRRVALLPAGSTLAMTFLLPTELVDQADRPAYEAAQDGARRSGTPFISFYTPDEMLALAHDAGFRRAEHVSSEELSARYFAGRADGLHPSTGEDFVVATT
jgi:O-methyltransferase involved in polyketide biosynthesis